MYGASDKVFLKITDNITINYSDMGYDYGTGERYIEEGNYEVVFHNSDIGNYVSISYGDDDFYYDPIYDGEIEDVRRDYGEEYVSESYSEGEHDEETGDFIPDPASASISLRSQHDKWFVSFTYDGISKKKVNKFDSVNEAVLFAIQELRVYYQKQYNDLGFVLFDFNFKLSKENDNTTDEET